MESNEHSKPAHTSTATLEASVRDQVAKHSLLADGLPVLVAVSGGADSVALLLALHRLGYQCVAAHCNFHLRGDESERDERFVRELCQRLGVRLVTTGFDVAAYQRQHGVSAEMACRELRYRWFEAQRQQLGCGEVAVAHHRDDNIETFFLNLMRGTGIDGLAGMRPRNGNVVRPLLAVSRANIHAYLQALGQDYVTDSTNLLNDVLRNKLRNVVLPAFEREFPLMRGAVARAIHNLSATRDLYRRGVDLLAMCVSEKDDEIDAESLLGMGEQGSTLLYELMKRRGFNASQAAEAYALAAGGTGAGRHFFSPGWELVIGRGKLRFVPLSSSASPYEEVPISLTDSTVDYPVRLMIAHEPQPPFSKQMVDGRHVVAFASGVLECKRVVLRRWRKGDRFKPFGLKGSKLVSDLFADAKLDEPERRAAWLLEADGCILWVLGLRAASAYAVPPASRHYLKITLL